MFHTPVVGVGHHQLLVQDSESSDNAHGVILNTVNKASVITAIADGDLEYTTGKTAIRSDFSSAPHPEVASRLNNATHVQTDNTYFQRSMSGY